MTDDTADTPSSANGEDAPLSESSDELIARAKDAFRQQPDSSRFEARTKHPEKIGQYRIVSVLGGGGMGTVYEAQQQSPQRAVALKVVRGERYLDEHAVRLFQREAQTLARLRHPGIAAIYEAGCTADGQHFFAMELVRGEVLNRSTRTRDLDERGRLRIFIKICDAINYAHQRGVIHRDLKPANIVIDADGLPKVLDFGLARITDADVAVATIVTDVGRIQGTLAYMSPEQARGNPDEIDLRSDVYSLGVILYELMTGRLPYDVGATALHEAVRTVCEDAPIRPSGIDRHLRGDMETIILKALEKDPSRRYQSAAALAEDIERFLTDRSVLATPPSALYQLRKLALRHKAGAAFTVAVFVLVLGFAIWMRVLYGAEQAQRMLADQNLSRAKTAEAQAEKEAETAREVKDFLVGVFEVSGPDENKGNTIRACEILDRGAARIKEELADQPAVQGELMHTMGLVYRNLGLYEPATELLEEALEVRRRTFDEPHLDIAESLHHLGWLYRHKGDYRRAEPLVDRALAMRRELLNAQHPDVIESSLILATVLRYRAEYAGAERLIREVLASQRETLGDEHEEVARILETLAELLTEVGDYDEAADAARLAMQMRKKLFRSDHSFVASSMQALAAALRGRGEYSEAEDLLRNAVEIYRKSMGADHQYYAEVVSSLGAVLRDQGDYQTAAPMLQQAVEVCRRRLEPDHPDIARSVARLGWLLIDQGDYGKAESLLREAVAIHRPRTGSTHPNLISPLVGLGRRGWAPVTQRGQRDMFVRHWPSAARRLPKAIG